jgi:hypothetical protein
MCKPSQFSTERQGMPVDGHRLPSHNAVEPPSEAFVLEQNQTSIERARAKKKADVEIVSMFMK